MNAPNHDGNGAGDDPGAARPIDAVSDPAAILASTTLTRQQKIDRLRQLSYDAREMDVANEEGMGGGDPSNHQRIAQALRALGADDEQTDAKH